MAYIGNTEGLCQAIVDNDFEEVQRWLTQGGGELDINRRDHTGRTPLHLACISSTPEIVQHLVDHGARIIARVADGRTALHLAAARGSVEIVRILVTKSEKNEQEEAEKEDARKGTVKGEKKETTSEDSDEDMVDDPSDGGDDDDYAHSNTTGSFVKVNKKQEDEVQILPDDSNAQDPDIYDINVQAWDNKASPLHLAILNGHVGVVEELVASFGADVLLPVKLVHAYNNSPRAAILTLVLALRLPTELAVPMTEKLLQVGASPAQADMLQKTALHYLSHYGAFELLEVYRQQDQPAVQRAINHLSGQGSYYGFPTASPLLNAINVKDRRKIRKLLEMGAHPSIGLEDFIKAVDSSEENRYFRRTIEEQKKTWGQQVTQPIIHAVAKDMPDVVMELLACGGDPNTLTSDGWQVIAEDYRKSRVAGSSLLDFVQAKTKTLRGYDGEKVMVEKPAELDPDDSAYLGGIEEGSYQMWFAREVLRDRRKTFDEEHKVYEEAVEEKENKAGLAEKKAAVLTLLAEFEKLEADLLARGAKTFKELHPDTQAPDHQPGYNRPRKSQNEPFKIDIFIRARNLTHEMKEGYLQL